MVKTVIIALIGAVVALVIVGGFMALDKTTLHWYVETSGASTQPPVRRSPTAEARPAFTSLDVLLLAPKQLVSKPFPQGTTVFRCTDASYRSGNQMWVVTCEYYAEEGDTSPLEKRTYLFDDRTGEVTR